MPPATLQVNLHQVGFAGQRLALLGLVGLPARSGEFAAVAIFSPERLIRKAITTGVLAAEGKRIPERVELRIPVHVSPPKTGAPQMNSMRAKSKQAAQRRQ